MPQTPSHMSPAAARQKINSQANAFRFVARRRPNFPWAIQVLASVDVRRNNPYSPPSVEIVASVLPNPETKPRGTSLLLRLLLLALGLLAAFCVFWFSAAVWEIVNLRNSDYGQHTPMWRASYVRSGAWALLFGTISLFACYRVKRRIRAGS